MNDEYKDNLIQNQKKIIEEMQEALRSIGDFADGLNNVLGVILEGAPEASVVRLTLTKITELVDQNI